MSGYREDEIGFTRVAAVRDASWSTVRCCMDPRSEIRPGSYAQWSEFMVHCWLNILWLPCCICEPAQYPLLLFGTSGTWRGGGSVAREFILQLPWPTKGQSRKKCQYKDEPAAAEAFPHTGPQNQSSVRWSSPPPSSLGNEASMTHSVAERWSERLFSHWRIRERINTWNNKEPGNLYLEPEHLYLE